MTFFQTIRILYRYSKPFRRLFFWGIIALLGVDILNVFPPLVLKAFIDQVTKSFSGDHRFFPFLAIGLVYLSIAVGQGLFRYGWRMFLIKASYKTAEKIREEYFTKLQRLPPMFYDKNPIGDLMSLATNDIEAIRFALGPGLLVLADAIFFVIFIPPAMFWLSPKFALFALAPMLVVPFIIIYIEKKIHDHFEKVQAQFSKLSAFAQETLEGIRIIKAFVREWTQLGRFGSLGKAFVRLNLKLTQSQSLFEPLFIFTTALGLVSLLIFCGPDVVSGKASIGTFVAFTRYLEQLVWPMMAFGLSVTYYQRGKTSLERVTAVLNFKEGAGTRSVGIADDLSEQPLSVAPSEILVEARNLTFTYPGRTHPVLKNISFRIPRGSRTAIVGPVGCGKSTLVRLLSGLYEVSPGMLFVNGQDISKISLSALRGQQAFVPQDVFLFLETLRWNVSFGEAIDNDQLNEVLIRSGLERELKEWELDKPIDERGLNLSVGQKARLTLARAYVKDAHLLILDDALSSIDAATESGILDQLHTNRDAQTLLMITHRFARLWKFDQILVLRDGDLVEQGAPADLSRAGGLYQQLMELQRMEDELAG